MTMGSDTVDSDVHMITVLKPKCLGNFCFIGCVPEENGLELKTEWMSELYSLCTKDTLRILFRLYNLYIIYYFNYFPIKSISIL